MGWEPIILTVSRSFEFYLNYDLSLQDRLPDNLRIYRTYSFECVSGYPMPVQQISDSKRFVLSSKIFKRGLFEVRKRLHNICSKAFFPDEKIGWIPFAYIKALKIIKNHDVKAVITSGMPHSTHLTGVLLKNKIDIKWLADFRDPWTDCEYISCNFRSTWRERLEKYLERKVVVACDNVILTTDSTRDLFMTKYQSISDKFHTITNSIDYEQFEKNQPIKYEKISLVYCGNFFGKRSPKYFLRGLALFLKTHPEAKSKVEVHFAGSFGVDESSGKWNREFISEYALSDIVTAHGKLPHSKCLSMLSGADLLLLISAPIITDGLYIPGKIFEYLAAKKPILAMVKGQGAISKLIKETDSGWVAEVDNSEDIAKALSLYWEDITNNATNNFSFSGLKNYTIESTTERLSALIKNTINA